MSDPVLPYGGASDPNSGFSGSETSEERARHLDQSGTTGRRQAEALRALAAVGATGLTWRELATMLEVHHGAASGVLSNLHKTGLIDRLTLTRQRSKVYVLPEYVNDRPTEAPKPNARDPYFEEVLPILGRMTCPTHGDLPDPWCPVCQDVERVFNLIRRYQREVQSQ